jgi:hypothetical protein
MVMGELLNRNRGRRQLSACSLASAYVKSGPYERVQEGGWSAWNPHGSIRRECVDHFIVLGEAHLRHILRTYARYYNNIRAHWSLDKDAPVYRPVQRIGSINSHAILGGLHHHYVRV